jgi:hypothetical protein
MSTAQGKTTIELYRLGEAGLDQALGPVESLSFLHVSSGGQTAEAGSASILPFSKPCHA